MKSEEEIYYHHIIPVDKDSKIVISCLSLLVAAIILLYYTVWVFINRNLVLFEIIIIVAGLACISFAIYKAVINLIWSFFGREIVSITDHDLFLKREMLGFVRNHAYNIIRISDFVQLPFKETTWSSVPLEFNDKCSLSFMFDEKKKYFGYNLDGETANKIFIELSKHIGGISLTPPNQALKLLCKKSICK